MTAGNFYRKVTIWRITEGSDDYAGGAVVTGTNVYNNIQFRMQSNPDDMLLLQQGFETRKTFWAMIIPGTLVVKERDEIEITFPPNDVYLGKRFRIVSANYSDVTDNHRKYIMLTLTRDVRAHREQ